MIKFCMRKAFKFLFNSLKIKWDSKMNFKEANEICMRHYFSPELCASDQFILPFRKNSSMKTMNSTFLKKIFSSPKFAHDYRIFLVHYDSIVDEDNQKKIDFLAHSILPLIEEKK